MDSTSQAFRLVSASGRSTYVACDVPDEDEDCGQFDDVPSVDINDL